MKKTKQEIYKLWVERLKRGGMPIIWGGMGFWLFDTYKDKLNYFWEEENIQKIEVTDEDRIMYNKISNINLTDYEIQKLKYNQMKTLRNLKIERINDEFLQNFDKEDLNKIKEKKD